MLEAPFIVVATQNPLDMEGTYPLPEAQRDRFTARISMGYPNRQSEIDMLSEHAATDPLDVLRAGVGLGRGARADRHRAQRCTSPPSMKAYAVDLATATRQSPAVRLGASPRASLQLVRAAKAWAAMEGRDYVIPDDLQGLVAARVRPPAAADGRGPHERARRRPTCWPRSSAPSPIPAPAERPSPTSPATGTFG